MYLADDCGCRNCGFKLSILRSQWNWFILVILIKFSWGNPHRSPLGAILWTSNRWCQNWHLKTMWALCPLQKRCRMLLNVVSGIFIVLLKNDNSEVHPSTCTAVTHLRVQFYMWFFHLSLIIIIIIIYIHIIHMYSTHMYTTHTNTPRMCSMQDLLLMPCDSGVNLQIAIWIQLLGEFHRCSAGLR